MHSVGLSQLSYRSYSRNHLCSQELVAVEEQAFVDAGTVAVQRVAVEQAVEVQLEEFFDLLVDKLVVPFDLALDKDHLDQRIQLCNQQECQDQSKSFHRFCAHY